MITTIKKKFTDHPRSVDETYLEHMGQAGYFFIQLFIASLVCLVHAILPFAFEKTGSRIITRLYGRMVTNRNRKAASGTSSGTSKAAPLSPDDFAGSGI